MQAEELMRKIEKEEVQFEHIVTVNDFCCFILQEQVSYQVNLVIG